MTIRELYPIWRKSKSRMVRESTINTYDTSYKNHIGPYFDNEDVSCINKKQTVSFMLRLRKKGLCIKSCLDVRIVLNMLIHFASSDLDLDVKDTHWSMEWPVEMKEYKEKGVKRYSDDEVTKIFNYVVENPTPTGLAVVLALSTGVRIGELCALTFGDVDLREGMVYVKRNVERIFDPHTGRTKIVFNEGKTENSRRSIPVTGDILKMLKNYARVCRSDYYITSCSPQLVEPRTFRCRYRKLVLEKVGLSHCEKPHAMRHTFASKLVESEAPVKIVAELLGHADVSTTLNVYSHPSDEMKRKALTKKLMPLFKKKGGKNIDKVP